MTYEAYLSAIAVTNIRVFSFYPQHNGKINWHRYETKLRHSHPYV